MCPPLQQPPVHQRVQRLQQVQQVRGHGQPISQRGPGDADARLARVVMTSHSVPASEAGPSDRTAYLGVVSTDQSRLHVAWLFSGFVVLEEFLCAPVRRTSVRIAVPPNC